MTRKAGALLVFWGLLCLNSVALAQQPLRWEPTLDQAQRIAAQTNRLVLIHFWANWCVVCKRMEAELLTQPAVSTALSANYVLVKIDADHFPATARQFGVTALPTTVILSPQGQVLDSIRGRLEPDQFLGRINTAVASTRQRNAAYAQIPPQQPIATPQADTQPSNPPGNAGALPTNNDRYADFYRRSQAATAPLGNEAAKTAQQPYNSTPVAGGPSLGYSQQPGLPSAVPALPTTVAQSGPPPYAAPRADSAMPRGQAAMPPHGLPANINVNPYSPATANPAPAYGSQQPAQPSSSPYGPTNTGLAMQPYASQSQAVPTTNPPAQYASVNAPALPTLPPGSPPLGIDGFCPVSLCEKQAWIPGDRRWGAIHRGRTYLFAGPEEQRRFFTDPDRFSPILSGNDVVLATDQNEMVPGMRRHGVFCGNRIYLFSSEATLEKFARNPSLYTNKALEALRSGARPAGQLR